MDTITQKALDFNSNLNINFDGGNLTSDAGMLLYKEFDEKIGFSKTIKNTLKIEDNIDHKKHENADVILQRIYQNAAGYHTDLCANELREDSVFQDILQKDILASQPTISRVNTKANPDNMKQLQQANFILQNKIYDYQTPVDKIIFDLDSTNCETYGQQYGSAYNHHYGDDGYHPQVLFNGRTGDLLKAELRSGNVYTSRQTKRFIGPVFKYYNKNFKTVPLYFRADSGFAKPGLYQLAEEHNISYTIRLKANAKLYEKAETIEARLLDKCQDNLYDKKEIFAKFTYQAQSWDKSRQVIVKAEKPKGEITVQFSFIVTNITAWEPKAIFEFYCQRSTMENFIKEAKHGFALGRMSSTEYWANACKLQQMVLAYNLNNWLRRLCFPESHKSDRIFTIRTKIVKIAARIIKTGRYFYYQLASSFPYKELFMNILNNIQKLEFA
ncbi:MAG: IS1380 family transposase [archaeon]